MASAVIIVVVLVLAPGIQSAVVQTGDLPSISNYPQAIHDNVQILPEFIEVPEFRPLPLPVPVPEVALPELAPAPLGNPCDACFSYMTALIDQLATVPEIQPHPMPEVEVEIQPHPMPTLDIEVVPENLPGALPLPDVEKLPHPVPEVDMRPLPEFIPVQPEFIPLPLIIDQ